MPRPWLRPKRSTCSKAAASSSADCVLLLGERLLDMLGDEALEALPPTQRLVVMECRASNHAAVDVAMGIPNRVERSGTWVNVDGTAGAIRAARSAPQGVRALVELLADLTTTSGQPEEALSS